MSVDLQKRFKHSQCTQNPNETNLCCCIFIPVPVRLATRVVQSKLRLKRISHWECSQNVLSAQFYFVLSVVSSGHLMSVLVDVLIQEPKAATVRKHYYCCCCILFRMVVKLGSAIFPFAYFYLWKYKYTNVYERWWIRMTCCLG